MEVTEKMTEFQLEKAATLKTIAIRDEKSWRNGRLL